MKKLIYLAILITFMFTACEYDIVKFGEDQYNVAFSSTDVEITESSTDTLMIPVVLARTDDGKSVTVNIDVDTESSTAVEDEDFTIISGSTLTFSDGSGIEYVEILAIDNSDYTGDKELVLTIGDVNVELAENSANSVTVSIVDDEHPLKAFLGTYTVSVSSGFGIDDYSFDVTVSSDADDDTKLWVDGWYCGYYGATCTTAFYMTVDTDEGTVSIPTPQDVGEPYGYTSSIYIWDFSTNDSASGDLTGTIQDNYDIEMSTDQGIAIEITDGDYTGYWLAAQYDVYWTKN